MLTVQDSPFYRVTVKALIFDDGGRLLLLKNGDDNWELPGGGWEHDEAFEDCLRREIQEELGVEVRSIGDIAFMYRGLNRRHGFRTLRLVAPAQLVANTITLGDGMSSSAFVDKAEFITLDLHRAEGDIQEYAERIWPES